MNARFANLQTNRRRSPLGVGEKPCYSFAVESDGQNVLLDSYKITLRDPAQRIVFENQVTGGGSHPLITSGMIDAPLEPFTRYTWTLEGICSSESATFAVTPASADFETGYIGEPLKNAEWITLGNAHYSGRCTDFRLEVGFVPNENQFSYIYSKNATVGIIFAAADEGNYYLLKLFTNLDEKKLTAAIFVCSDGVTSQLCETDVSDILVPADFIGSEHTVVISAGEPLTILLDGHPVISEKLEIRAGGFGFSQPYPASSRFTRVKFDSSDEQIFEDFSDPDRLIFTGGILGNGYTVIQKNALFPLDFAPAPVFRRDFNVRSGLVSARINASAAGIYELFLNGKKVSDTCFDPGRTRVQSRVMYQTFDLTGLLKTGENTLSVSVGHGWYNRAMNYAGTTLAFIGEIMLEYEDGEESIVTGSDWLSNADGSVRYDDIFNGEIIDARKALSPESNGWTNARTTTADALSIGSIVPQNGPQVKCFEILEPVAVTEPLPGLRVYDFGKNIIPKMLEEKKKLIVYRFEGYWRDVGTVDSYYESQMDLMDDVESINVFTKDARVFSNSNIYPPQYIGPEANIGKALISNGCTVYGDVDHSILGSGVVIGEGSVIKDSIILPNAIIGRNCTINKSIVNEGVVVDDRTEIGDADGKIVVYGTSKLSV